MRKLTVYTQPEPPEESPIRLKLEETSAGIRLIMVNRHGARLSQGTLLYVKQADDGRIYLALNPVPDGRLVQRQDRGQGGVRAVEGW